MDYHFDQILIIQPARIDDNPLRILINPTIIIIPIQRLDQSVIGEAREIIVGQLLRIRLAGDKILQTAQPIRPSDTFSTTNCVERHDTIVQTHADELVGCVCRIVAVLRWVVLSPMLVDGDRVLISAADDFCDEFCAERSDFGHSPVSLGVGWVVRQAWRLVKVVDAHSCQDGDDDVVVGEVGVEGSVEREVLGVVGERAIDAAVACGDVLVCQAGEEFLEVAETLRAACGIAIAVVVCITLAGCCGLRPRNIQ